MHRQSTRRRGGRAQATATHTRSVTTIEFNPNRARDGRFAPGHHDEVDLDLGSAAAPAEAIDRSLDRDLPDAVVRPGRRRPEHLSFSAMNDYAYCPASYALRRIDGSEATNEPPARGVGDGTHKALEALAAGGDRDAVLAELAQDPKFADRAEEIGDMVDRCVDWPLTDPNRPSLRESEVHIEATIDGVPLVGEIDCVEVDEDGVVVISDYKTTAKAPAPIDDSDDPDGMPSKDRMYRAHVTRQVVLYAEMAEETGRHIGRVRMLYPARRSVVEVDLDDERGQLLRTEARRFVTYQADQIARSFDTGRFPTRPSPNKCGACSMADACPAAGAATQAA